MHLVLVVHVHVHRHIPLLSERLLYINAEHSLAVLCFQEMLKTLSVSSTITLHIIGLKNLEQICDTEDHLREATYQNTKMFQ